MIPNEPLISIIIPAYNTAPYIGRMLDCVTNQTYKNLEIIVVNDGSIDETLSIVENYAKKDSRFVVIDIPNGGVSNARNEGIWKCKGEKIFFWDSDDVIEHTAIEQCLKFAETHHVNAVIYGYSNLHGTPHKTILGNKCFFDNDIQKEVLPCYIGHSFKDVNNWIKGKGMRHGKESTALWHMMCDTNTIKKNGILFDCNLSLGEDTIFTNTYLLYETSIGYLNECLYYLDQREDGANLSSIRNLSKRLKDKILLIEARKKIDKLSVKLYNSNTHKYWNGTLVFSAIELAIRLSKDKQYSKKENLHRFLSYMKIDVVAQAYKDFRPNIGLKGLPFLWIKYLGATSFFYFCNIIPNKIVDKLTKS